MCQNCRATEICKQVRDCIEHARKVLPLDFQESTCSTPAASLKEAVDKLKTELRGHDEMVIDQEMTGGGLTLLNEGAMPLESWSDVDHVLQDALRCIDLVEEWTRVSHNCDDPGCKSEPPISPAAAKSAALQVEGTTLSLLFSAQKAVETLERETRS